MTGHSWWRPAANTAITVTLALAPWPGSAQVATRTVAVIDSARATSVPRPRAAAILSRDSLVVVANGRYDAGSVHRFLMGNTYRDFWELPITVPVLDLEHFAGGLEATEEGGGNQTRSLRFQSSDKRTWTFRPLTKDKLSVILAWEGTPVMDLFRDGLSGSFPGAPVVTPPFLEAAGIPHPKPLLVVLPDDDRLAEFRNTFGGRLGTIEEHVSDAKGDPGFDGALEVIDSDDLLELMNTKPGRHIDPRQLLTARLIDILLGDTDRHRDQWKWGLMESGDSLFTPIPRDRDQVLATHDGLLLHAARTKKSYLVVFDSGFAKVETMVGYARDLDDRMLAELDWPAWNACATDLQRVLTDSVIHSALYALPREYHSRLGTLEGKLRDRRDHLHEAAADYYRSLSQLVNVHATDAADHARITRSADGFVQVMLGGTTPWFSRRFDPGETGEVRVYLHGGHDTATVTGIAGPGITVRIIGGGGDNALVDSSTRPAGTAPTRLYDRGRTRNENYAPDSAFNRLPWLHIYGTSIRPARDRGAVLSPVVSLKTGRGLGIVPGIGIRQYRYGFRSVPYRTMVGLQAAYSTAVGGYRLFAQGDLRPPQMRLHVGGEAEMTQFEIVQFQGLGNDVAYARGPRYDVRQRQWIARPWAGYAFGLHRDLTLGPVLKYVATDSIPNTVLSSTSPYGVGNFGQAGVELKLTHDTRDSPANPLHGFFTQVTASSYPKLWSVTSAFHRMAATASTYLRVPGRKQAVLALRAGGEKVFGAFPYYEAAFLGGSRNLRALRHQQVAGDASLFANAELRVPVARVPLVLPWHVGLLGYAEGGRVFVGGESPGGWQHAVGGGFWLGVLGPTTGVSVLFTTGRERRTILGTGVSF